MGKFLPNFLANLFNTIDKFMAKLKFQNSLSLTLIAMVAKLQ